MCDYNRRVQRGNQVHTHREVVSTAGDPKWRCISFCHESNLSFISTAVVIFSLSCYIRPLYLGSSQHEYQRLDISDAFEFFYSVIYSVMNVEPLFLLASLKTVYV